MIGNVNGARAVTRRRIVPSWLGKLGRALLLSLRRMRAALRRRLPMAALFATAVVIAAALAAVAPLTGSMLRGQSAEHHDCAAKTPQEVLSNANVQAASELEFDGRIEDAEQAYRAVLSSSNACVRGTALAALDRLSGLHDRLGPGYRVLVDIAAWSGKLLTPMVLVFAGAYAIVFGWACVRLNPARGIRIDDFPVYGSRDARAGRQFRDAVLWFANDIKRVYGSDFARNIGITLFYDDLQGKSLEGKSISDEVIAGVAEADAKAAARVALTQVFRALRDALQRPEFRVSGDVRLFPGSAKAAGTIVHASTGRLIRIEASTLELAELPARAFVESRLLAAAGGTRDSADVHEADELRRASGQLYALALVFACKIRFAEAQASNNKYRPNSWQTLCLYTAGALALE